MKAKKYPVYYMQFLDHVMDSAPSAAPILCEVFGVLWKHDSLAYYIVPWVANGNISDPNNEAYVVLKSTVLKKKRLA